MRRIIAVGLALVTLSGCGGGEDEAATTSTVGQQELDIWAETSNGLVAIQETDDDPVCYFGQGARVEVRDADGTVLAAEDLVTGDATRNGGVYECIGRLEITVEPSDFYEVTVSGGSTLLNGTDEWTNTVTVSAAEAAAVIHVPVDT